MDIGMKARESVLIASLLIEKMTSAFLAELLGIKDPKNSRVLGNKGGCFSFNQKIDLLIEIGAIPEKYRNKFQAFMEVRNQFMHNISASTFEKCFSFTNGKDTFLLKTYPQSDKLSKEEALKEATGQLTDDIGKLSIEILRKIEDKYRKEEEVEVLKKKQNAFLDIIKQTENALNDFFVNEIERNPSIDTEWLEGFGTEVKKVTLDLLKKNLEEIAGKG